MTDAETATEGAEPANDADHGNAPDETATDAARPALRAAALGLVAGVAGGVVATAIDPPGTVLTVLVALATVAAVTLLARRATRSTLLGR